MRPWPSISVQIGLATSCSSAAANKHGARGRRERLPGRQRHQRIGDHARVGQHVAFGMVVRVLRRVGQVVQPGVLRQQLRPSRSTIRAAPGSRAATKAARCRERRSCKFTAGFGRLIAFAPTAGEQPVAMAAGMVAMLKSAGSAQRG